MSLRYASRTRDGIPVSQWVNPRQPLGISYSRPRLTNPAFVTITADTNAHTYGAWTEVIASLPSNTSVLTFFCATSGSTIASASVFSVGVGSSGNEVELFAFAAGSANGLDANIRGSYFKISIPVQIESGTRIAVRFQSVITGGRTGTIAISTFDSDPNTFVFQPKKYDVLGLNLSTSRGVALSATASTYTEIIASTSTSYRGLVLIPSASNATQNTTAGVVTVAVGAAGAEVDIGDVSFRGLNVEALIVLDNSFIPSSIASGSRISVKQSSTQSYIDAMIIGVV